MDDELLKQFERLVPQGKRGVWVNKAIKRQLEEERVAEIRRRMDEFFDDEESMELYAEIERDWAPLSDEVWAKLPDEEWPEPATVLPNGYAAYLAEYQEAESNFGGNVSKSKRTNRRNTSNQCACQRFDARRGCFDIRR